MRALTVDARGQENLVIHVGRWDHTAKHVQVDGIVRIKSDRLVRTLVPKAIAQAERRCSAIGQTKLQSGAIVVRTEVC